MEITPPEDEALELFWARARKVAGLTRLDVVVGESELAALIPPAWSFGTDAEEADELLALVVAGVKTATASALWEWEAEGEELPHPGDLSIVCDGSGEPRLLVRTTGVDVVPFDQVGPEHAAAEGEGDRSLEHWRRVHEKYFAAVLEPYGRAFAPDMPVVLETFTVVYPLPRRRW
ncbi:ASCH domain-containing protein [Georgenia sp. AZ-5]|uniref:ASCH domain-containing protein n=1 Tax=Georgenia sp. AZ-5 TaxID=3367526 RepID=UPI0037548BB6